MAHARKEVRRVLNDMGFNNGFEISDESLESQRFGGILVVTIIGWKPHPGAIALKRRLNRCFDNGVDVRFQMCGN